jgi:hypothetical protein
MPIIPGAPSLALRRATPLRHVRVPQRRRGAAVETGLDFATTI